jgi:hypothetical protein
MAGKRGRHRFGRPAPGTRRSILMRASSIRESNPIRPMHDLVPPCASLVQVVAERFGKLTTTQLAVLADASWKVVS